MSRSLSLDRKSPASAIDRDSGFQSGSLVRGSTSLYDNVTPRSSLLGGNRSVLTENNAQSNLFRSDVGPMQKSSPFSSKLGETNQSALQRDNRQTTMSSPGRSMLGQSSLFGDDKRAVTGTSLVGRSLLDDGQMSSSMRRSGEQQSLLKQGQPSAGSQRGADFSSLLGDDFRRPSALGKYDNDRNLSSLGGRPADNSRFSSGRMTSMFDRHDDRENRTNNDGRSIDSRSYDGRSNDSRSYVGKSNEARSFDEKRSNDGRSYDDRRSNNLRSYDDRQSNDPRFYDDQRSHDSRSYDDRRSTDRHPLLSTGQTMSRTAHDRDNYDNEMRRGRLRWEEDEEETEADTHYRQLLEKNNITANLSGTKYEVVRRIVEKLGFTISHEDDLKCFLIWNDMFVSTERISEMKPYQRVNHFPGMGEISRKDSLAKNMAKFHKAKPNEFPFAPKTFVLPLDYANLQNHFNEVRKNKKRKTFIVKPANGAMGNGISLHQTLDKIPQNENIVVQEYIDKPFLVDGYKCDMRIYVLVTSCDPLRVFLYHDGLLRMSTEKYVAPMDNNLEHAFMHLTNYSVNKHNDHYEKSGDVNTGSKRSLKYFNEYLRKRDFDVPALWRSIADLLIKTIIAAFPHVYQAYRTCRPGHNATCDSVCFEILGFDIMLDQKLRPWLIEVNRSPSFGTDEKIDYDIKSGMLHDALRLVNIRPSDKQRNMAVQKAEAQKRLMRPTKRVQAEVSEMERRRLLIEKKREDLKEQLARLHHYAELEEFENRHCRKFRRIFPPDDKFKRDEYLKLISESFEIVMPGRAQNLQQEFNKFYCSNLQEADILQMLAECDEEELKDNAASPGTFTPITNKRAKPSRITKPPKTPSRIDDDRKNTDSDSDMEGQGQGRQGRSKSLSRLGTADPDSRQTESRGQSRVRSSLRPLTVANGAESSQTTVPLDSYEQRTQSTLDLLNDMRIKFPGKTDKEADLILDQINENWKFHKPRIASYWLVKLDSIKRAKVIDIVRVNVRVVLQRVWLVNNADMVPLARLFNRVFNRMLWSRGQGLWSCFQSGSDSWQAMFTKTTEPVTERELACCQRIVQLCSDCLLIVYQYAQDMKRTSPLQRSVTSMHLLMENKVPSR